MAEMTKVYVWRRRGRGFLVVLAKSVDEAREKALEQDGSFSSFVSGREPEAEGTARSGEVLYIKQR